MNGHSRLIGFLTALVINYLGLSAQLLPPITNYSPTDYNAHNQNWDVTHNEDGHVFYANTHGLLHFDGLRWRLYRHPQNSTVRSVSFYRGEVYSGSYGDFGKWTLDECGVYHYISLTQGKVDLKGEEIWHIEALEGALYFQSFSIMYRYDGISFRQISLPSSIMFARRVKDKLLLQCQGNGLYTIDKNGKPQPMASTSIFDGKTISGIVGVDDTIIVSTVRDGIYMYENNRWSAWKPSLQRYFIDKQVNKIFSTRNKSLVVGTIRDGISLYRPDGTFLYKVNTNGGLLNNTVLSLASTNDDLLWIGLDKGCAVVETNSPFRVFNDIHGSIGTVYTTIKVDHLLYVGTNQGLYVLDLSSQVDPNTENNFSLIPYTQGQVWSTLATSDGFICGHNEGTFLVKGKNATKISNLTGGWHAQYFPDSQQWILQGHYTGLCLYQSGLGGTRLKGIFKNFNFPVRRIQFIDHQTALLDSPNRGLIKVKLDYKALSIQILEEYNTKNKIILSDNIDLQKIVDQIYVHDGHHLYLYSDKGLVKQSESERSPQIREDCLYNLYHIYPDSITLTRKNTKQVLHLKLSTDYNNILPIDTQWTMLTHNDGFSLLDLSTKIRSHKPKWNQILLSDGTCIPIQNQKINIPYHQKNITISLSGYPYYASKIHQLTMSSDNNTSIEHLENGELHLHGLSEGIHELALLGQSSAPLILDILPPWHRTTWAYLTYVGLIGLILYRIKRYYEKQNRIQAARLLEENQRLVREYEVELENQKLHHENLLKSKELANATLHLVQKNEVLEDIKHELIEIRKVGEGQIKGKEIQNIMKKIDYNVTLQDDRHLFETNFEEVHGAFIEQLRKRFPHLTPIDLKLSAYIKMNIPSKDLAPIFNISVRGLENKRYRLRKKLGLESEANLYQYFNDIAS
jgi:AraC family transcriptional regulator, chitin signaling transcriptional activator